MRSAAVAIALLSAVVAGCGDDRAVLPDAAVGGVPVRVTGTVEADGDGWRMCPGGEPPCWAVVDDGGFELAAGDAALVGVVSDVGLALTATPSRRPHEPVTFPVPCDDASRLGDGSVDQLSEYTASIPEDFAGMWMGDGGRVPVVAVVRDAEAHRSALAARGMAVCVTEDDFRFTERELLEAQAELHRREAAWREAGWSVTSSGTWVVDNVLQVQLDQVDPRLVDEITGTWGDKIRIRASVEVLEGTVDDLPAPPRDDGGVTIETVPRGSGHMQALGRFTLRYDGADDCVYLEAADGTKVKPVWPHGTQVRRDPVRAVDGRGSVIAEAGDTFETGGGLTGPPAADDPLACGADDTWVM